MEIMMGVGVGWGRGPRWGENGDNCMWTTIKNKVKFKKPLKKKKLWTFLQWVLKFCNNFRSIIATLFFIG